MVYKIKYRYEDVIAKIRSERERQQRIESKKNGGLVMSGSHEEGGQVFRLEDTGESVELEGGEVVIPRHIIEGSGNKIFRFYGTPRKVLNETLQLAGLSISDRVTKVRAGDVVICIPAVWSDERKLFKGTLLDILNELQTSKGCNPLLSKRTSIGRNTTNIKKPNISDHRQN